MATRFSGDYRNCCRLCLSKGGRLLPIFGHPCDGLESLYSTISTCLSIEVSELDDFPKQICHRCECQLNVWRYFKLECELSQEKLRKWNSALLSGSRHSEYVDEDEGFLRTVINVKLEPVDDDSHLENPIDCCSDVGSVQLVDNTRPVEETNSSNNDSLDFADCDPSEASVHLTEHRPEESHHSLSLVISGTSSVAAEDNIAKQITSASEENRSNIVANSTLHSVDNHLSNNKESDDEMTVLRTGAQRNNILEEAVPKSGDASHPPSDLSQEVPVSPEFVNFHNSTTLSGVGITCEDPLKVAQEESVEPQNVLFRVKEEPMDVTADYTIQTQPSSVFTMEQNVSSKSLSPFEFPSSSSSPITSHHKQLLKKKKIKSFIVKRNAVVKDADVQPSGTASGSDQVYNYSSIDLPAISNELFDEETKFCKSCGKTFTNLWRHMKTVHANVNPFKCAVCRKTFPGRRELVTHRVRTVSKYCRAGKEPDVDVSEIMVHSEAPPGQKGRYECLKCKEMFTKLSFAKSHLRLHSGEKPFFCFKCNDKEFRLRKSALKHVAVCDSKRNNPAVVQKRDSSILASLLKGRGRNEVKPVLSQEKRLKCTKCGKVYGNGTALSNHLRVDCVRKCFSCCKMVPRKTFHRHFQLCLKAKHSYVKSEDYTSTSTSSEATDNVEGGQSHRMANSSLEKKTIEDSVMDTTPHVPRKNAPITKVVDLSVKDLIAMHRDTREKSSSIMCQLCNKTMASRKTLYAHLLKHSSRVFKCEVCSLRMSLRTTYEAHMTNIHNILKDNKNNESLKDLNLHQTESSKLDVKAPNPLKTKTTVKFTGFKIAKLKCEICLKLFSSATSLKYHKQSHKKVKCENCDLTFPANIEKSHICAPKIKVEPSKSVEQTSMLLAKGKPVEYTCHLCQKKFHTRKILYQHKKMHIKMKILKCQECDNSYSDLQALQHHKDSEHSSGPVHPPSTNNLQELNCTSDATSSKNNKSDVQKCPVCLKEYSKRNSLTKHMLLHKKSSKESEVDKVTPENSPQVSTLYHCNICDKSFGSKVSFCGHKGWHSRNDPKESSNSSLAPEANSSATEKPSILASLEVTNVPPSTDKTFNCNICLKKFSSPKNLKLHLNHHDRKMSGSPQLYVKETMEETVSASASSESLSQGITQHNCKICSTTFPDLSSLTLHMTTHPSNSTNTTVPNNTVKQELFQCQLCTKQYRSRQSFKYHMMGHSGENPYKCRSCSNQYSNPKALAKHEKERHTLVLRPFCCSRCKTSFILKEDLLAHYEKCSH